MLILLHKRPSSPRGIQPWWIVCQLPVSKTPAECAFAKAVQSPTRRICNSPSEGGDLCCCTEVRLAISACNSVCIMSTVAPNCATSTVVQKVASQTEPSFLKRPSGQPALLPSLQYLNWAPLHLLHAEALETVVSHQEISSLEQVLAEQIGSWDSLELACSTFEPSPASQPATGLQYGTDVPDALLNCSIRHLRFLAQAPWSA